MIADRRQRRTAARAARVGRAARWALLGLLSIQATACGRADPPVDDGTRQRPRPDLLLITVDTLRPDAVGWIGGGDHTPEIDALAAGGVAFPAAVAPTPLTLPSHTTMFSGLVPRRHGVRDNHQVVGAAPPLLAERLAAAGYDTAAVVSGFPLSTGFGLDRGFARYDDLLTAGEGAWLERRAAETVDAAESSLAALRSPWFLWVHFYDPHFPYEPPAEHRREGIRGAYVGEVAYVDTQIARLRRAASRRSGGSDGQLTVFAADHGEALGEHGEGTHGFFIYDDTMLVPLVFHWPGRLAPARRAEPARLVDLTPTLLDLLALAPIGGGDEIDGVSLAPALGGAALDVPAAYLETLQPWNSYGWSPLAAVRHDGWKLIAAPRPELYDLATDPDEANNRYDDERHRARRLGSILRQREERPAVSAVSIVDRASLEQLRALGYLGTPAAGEIPPRDTLRDPKDQVVARELLTEADAALRRGDFTAAERASREVLATDPTNRFAQLRLGLALARAGDVGAAVAELGHAVELAPGDPEARAAYAEVLTGAGRPAEAVAHWLEVVAIQPRRVTAWSNLGATLGLSGEAARAVAAYEKAADLDPDNPERWIRLGFAAFGAGDGARAAASLERAATMSAPAPFPHAGALGLVLQPLGRAREAERWLAASQPAEGDYPQARLALARLVLERGDRIEARRILVETMTARPDATPLISGDPVLAALVGPG